MNNINNDQCNECVQESKVNNPVNNQIEIDPNMKVGNQVKKEGCNENGLKVNGECFNDFGDENLFCNVLKDEKENKKLFENLKNMKIMLYTIEHNLFIEGK